MKQLKLATNYNNKLGNKIITHIDAAPPAPVPVDSLPITYEIVTADGSHAPIEYELFSIIGGDLNYFYNDTITMPSHGMERFEFADWYLKMRPHPKNNPPMAIYFYRLIC